MSVDKIRVGRFFFFFNQVFKVNHVLQNYHKLVDVLMILIWSIFLK
jgi:hypothetical protein